VSEDSQYEVGRASDVLLFAANQALIDDSRVFSCDLTAHGKSRKVYTLAEPLLGAITAIRHSTSLNQVITKWLPRGHQQPRGTQAREKTPVDWRLRCDILYERAAPEICRC